MVSWRGFLCRRPPVVTLSSGASGRLTDAKGTSSSETRVISPAPSIRHIAGTSPALSDRNTVPVRGLAAKSLMVTSASQTSLSAVRKSLILTSALAEPPPVSPVAIATTAADLSQFGGSNHYLYTTYDMNSLYQNGGFQDPQFSFTTVPSVVSSSLYSS